MMDPKEFFAVRDILLEKSDDLARLRSAGDRLAEWSREALYGSYEPRPDYSPMEGMRSLVRLRRALRAWEKERGNR